MAGGYPACLDDEENDELLTVLLRDMGIDTFVCLQSEVWPDVPDAAWRAGRAPRPYTRDIRRLMSSGRDALPNAKIDFLHLPIVDGTSPPTTSWIASATTSSARCSPAGGPRALLGRPRAHRDHHRGHARAHVRRHHRAGARQDAAAARRTGRPPKRGGAPRRPCRWRRCDACSRAPKTKSKRRRRRRRRRRRAQLEADASKKRGGATSSARRPSRARTDARSRRGRGGARALVLRGEFAAHARGRGRHADQAVAVRKRVVSFSSSRSSAKRCLVLLYCRVSETYVAPCDMRRMGRSCEHARA